MPVKIKIHSKVSILNLYHKNTNYTFYFKKLKDSKNK